MRFSRAEIEMGSLMSVVIVVVVVVVISIIIIIIIFIFSGLHLRFVQM
jgi:hypothetical protein